MDDNFARACRDASARTSLDVYLERRSKLRRRDTVSLDTRKMQFSR
jgi:hypothetical protein